MKCPHCNENIDVRFIKAPPDSQPSSSAGTKSLAQLLDEIDDGALEGAALDFVTKTRERFEQYREKTRMSEKQMSWLEDIASGKTGNRDSW